jgi:two-component sensor histidine kinase
LQRHFDISVISPAPGKFATVFQDITERKQAEEATQRRAAHLALLNDIGLKVSATLAVEEVLDRAALLLQKYFNYHHVGIFLLDAERSAMVMRARAGQYSHLFPPQHAVPLTQGIVGWVGTHGNRLVVNDVTADPHYQNFYPESIPTRAEMCIPIQSKEKIIGALDIQSSQVNAFGEEDILVVEILAGQIAAALENSHLYTQTQINLKERETLLKEVHHRVKNNLQIIISLLSLRSESIQDEHALQVFQDCQNSVRSISFIHEKLYQSTNLARISAESYFHDLIQHLKMVFSGQAVAINILVSIEPVMLDIETAIPCGLIITELITNAIKHAFPASYPENAPRSLHIELQSVGDRLKLLVSDNGVGLPPNFTLEHHHSLGLQLVSLLVKQLRGSLSISGEGGAAFCIEFPRPPAA